MKKLIGASIAILFAVLLSQSRTIALKSPQTGVSLVYAQTPSLPPVALFGSALAVKEYVLQEAIEAGVPPERADFIIEHESQYCGWGRDGFFNPNIEGDDGKSIGCWQIYLKAHPDVSRACASDLICSTAWAMENLKTDASSSIWSAWRFKNLWYNKK